jgi:hypothetical protein
MFGLRSAEGTQDGENGTVRSSMIGRRRQIVFRCKGRSGLCSGMYRVEESEVKGTAGRIGRIIK